MAHLGQQILADVVHNLFPTEASTTATALGHGIQDGGHCLLNLQGSEGQVCIGVQAVHFRALLARQGLYGSPEGVDVGTVRDPVAEATAIIPVQLVVGLRDSNIRWAGQFHS